MVHRAPAHHGGPGGTAISLMEKACSTWPYSEVADLAP